MPPCLMVSLSHHHHLIIVASRKDRGMECLCWRRSARARAPDQLFFFAKLECYSTSRHTVHSSAIFNGFRLNEFVKYVNYSCISRSSQTPDPSRHITHTEATQRSVSEERRRRNWREQTRELITTARNRKKETRAQVKENELKQIKEMSSLVGWFVHCD